MHQIGPWWHGPGGLVVAILAVIAITIAVITAIVVTKNYFDSRNLSRQQHIETQEQHEHDLAMEEQRTLQADAAKGNPDMLKLIRERI